MNKETFQGAHFVFELEDNFSHPFDGILTVYQAIDGKLLEKHNGSELASHFGVEEINNSALGYLRGLELTKVYSFHDERGIKIFKSLFPNFKLIREDCGGDRVRQYHGLSIHYWKELFEGAGIKLIFIDDLISNSSKRDYIRPTITKSDPLTEITF